MEFIIDDKLIDQPQPKESISCEHKIVVKTIEKIIYRFCGKCGMVAHADGKFSYRCGSEWCRCSS